MNRPTKPGKPTKPKKTIEEDSWTYRIWDAGFIDLGDIISRIEKETQLVVNPKEIFIEIDNTDEYSADVIIKYPHSYSIINDSYETEYKKYVEKLTQYKAKLEIYEKDLETYRKWATEEEAKDLNKRLKEAQELLKQHNKIK